MWNGSLSKRIDRFVDGFIRSDVAQQLTAERDADYINEPERADRCAAAADNGADGKTHREQIDDWRDAFAYWLRDVRRGRRHGNEPVRFSDAVTDHFDAIETWHTERGTIDQEIG